MRTLIDSLRYPLATAGLAYIAPVSILLAMSVFAGLLGFPAGAILLSWTFKYVFICLEDSARGGDEPPVPGIEQLGPFADQRPLKLALLVAGQAGIVVWLNGAVGTEVAALVGLMFVVFTPAMLTGLALENGIVAAMNPANLFAIMVQLGRGYIAVSLGLVACLAGVALMIRHGPVLALTIAVSIYLLLATSRFIGLVLRARGAALGVNEPDVTPALSTSPSEAECTTRDLRHLLDRIHPPSQVGRAREVYPRLRAFLREHGDSLDLHERIHRELVTWAKPRLALLHAGDYADHLYAAGQGERALDVVETALGRSDGLTLPTSAVQWRLARHAAEQGRHSTAAALLAALREGFPDAPEQGRALLAEGLLRMDRLDDPVGGAELLRAWADRHPEHPKRARILRKLDTGSEGAGE